MAIIGGEYGSHNYVEIVLQCYGFEAPVRDSVMWEVVRILSTTQDNDILNHTKYQSCNKYIYIFIAALIFLFEYFRITRAFCILPYCTVYIVRSL